LTLLGWRRERGKVRRTQYCIELKTILFILKVVLRIEKIN
jgi:hypothetical protein